MDARNLFPINQFDYLTFIKDLRYEYVDGAPKIIFQGKDITDALVVSAQDQCASRVSALLVVRKALLAFQREVAQQHDVVADGRDCGSVVFPQAEHKFFLTARVAVRAQRVMLDAQRNDAAKDIDHVVTMLEERDQRDSQRKDAPLTIPDQATVIDNSDLSFEQTVATFLKHITMAGYGLSGKRQTEQ